jgi:hypothetical protein
MLGCSARGRERGEKPLSTYFHYFAILPLVFRDIPEL